ncbi:hypothetical protein KJ763_00405 [Patescibacteria group bacterium]|nr:hypothetical protein [Patescibacteria group bacterium]
MQLERWKKFSKKEQLRALSAEFLRAGIWQKKDNDNYKSAIERAISIVDFSINDEKWLKQKKILFGLRDILAEIYLNKSKIKDINLVNQAL